MSATYTKLKTGEWGIRSTYPINAGSRVVVSKKSGGSKLETIDRVLWSGNGIWLASIVPSPRQSGCGCSCDDCSRGCRCEPHCNCRGGNIFDCE